MQSEFSAGKPLGKDERQGMGKGPGFSLGKPLGKDERQGDGQGDVGRERERSRSFHSKNHLAKMKGIPRYTCSDFILVVGMYPFFSMD